MTNVTPNLALPRLRTVRTVLQGLYESWRPQPLPAISARLQILFVAIAVGVGLSVGYVRLVSVAGLNDLWLAYGSAELLWQGLNPYDYPTDGWPSNPLTTVMLIAPFVAFSLEHVAVGMVAVTTALFVYGAARSGQPLRLWALASWPFWYNVVLAQWGILFLAMLLLPGLVWLVPVKPQLGLSVFLSRFQWRQALWAGMFMLVSLLIYPSWPLHWLGQVGGYDGFVPLTYLPLMLLALLLVWRRGISSHRVGFYLLFCLSPQRIWHDQVLLWYVPTRAWQIGLLTALSWASPLTMRLLDANWVLVACLFVPCGLFLLLDRPGDGGCVAGDHKGRQ